MQQGEAVVRMYAAREEIYAREVSGPYASLRWVVVWLTQLVFYGVPWLQWNDRQAVLFDLGARKFYLFGIVLWPQDFIYLAALLMICAYGLFLVTAIAGRVWCGYGCPQTVYTEIFMWVERKIEGTRSARMRLDRQPWSLEKLARKLAKHAVWGAIALWTGFTFVAYFTPLPLLGKEVIDLALGPWEWFWILFYSFATYGNAGWMREQVCKYMCPYARFQSAMFDKDTLIVTYDEARGEPRSAKRAADNEVSAAQEKQGDCIDCSLCVQVCPTGIDIRKGLQYECIGCAACVDACNIVMDKTEKPHGLIRYGTENGMTRHYSAREMLAHIARPRVLIYTTILCLIIGLVGTSLATRNKLKVDVLRDRGSMGREVEDGEIENVYRLQIMNTDEHTHTFDIAVTGIEGIHLEGPIKAALASTQTRAVPVRVRLPHGQGQKGSNRIEFIISAQEDAEMRVTEKAVFIVPHD